jgi:hypothetical protein
VRRDEISASSAQELVRLAKHVIGGNGLDDTGLDLAVATLGLYEPCFVYIGIIGTIEIRDQGPQQFKALLVRKRSYILLNVGNRSCHD